MKGMTLVGSVIWAPYAAMLLETLAAWGVRSIIFFGWCGAVSRDVNIGDIVVPSSAMIDEGTSLHYGFSQNDESHPAGIAPGRIVQTLEQAQIPFHRGPVWSTDGIFRETPEKVRQYQQRGVLAVDMETSAVFSVGNFRKVEADAVLVVSDDLSDLSWHPGFKDPRFQQARQNVYCILEDVCLKQTIRLS
jgi:uridine phosphorylase